MRGGGDDPRLVAQAAERAYRQSALGHAETVVKSSRPSSSMARGQEYSVR